MLAITLALVTTLQVVIRFFPESLSFSSIPSSYDNRSQSIRNQESAVQPDHHGSGPKDLIQGDMNQRGPEQNVWSSAVLRHDDVSHLEEYQEYVSRGKEYLGRLV